MASNRIGKLVMFSVPKVEVRGNQYRVVLHTFFCTEEPEVTALGWKDMGDDVFTKEDLAQLKDANEIKMSVIELIAEIGK